MDWSLSPLYSSGGQITLDAGVSYAETVPGELRFALLQNKDI